MIPLQQHRRASKHNSKESFLPCLYSFLVLLPTLSSPLPPIYLRGTLPNDVGQEARLFIFLCMHGILGFLRARLYWELLEFFLLI